MKETVEQRQQLVTLPHIKFGFLNRTPFFIRENDVPGWFGDESGDTVVYAPSTRGIAHACFEMVNKGTQ